jgi:hypothetical protein
MVIYGKYKQYWNDSIIVRKINEANIYWEYKLITDHLSHIDKCKTVKSLIKGSLIFASLESGVHSFFYHRPYSLADFNISHKNIPKCVYHTLFAEDYLQKFMGEYKLTVKEFPGTIFVCSNTSKIKYVQDTLNKKFRDIHLFGSFSKKVPIETGHFHVDSRNLISKYKSAICIENSDEIGYIQGNFLFALLSGTVPIIKASEPILKNILLPECYYRYSEFLTTSKDNADAILSSKSEYLLSGGEMFTNLAKEYLHFTSEMNFLNLSSTILESQNFKRKIFNL